MSIVTQEKQVDSIQVLRAVCILLVLLGHALMIYGMGWNVPRGIGMFTAFLILTGKGFIDIFFAGSGFIMVYVTWRYFGTIKSTWPFFFRRLTRILPAFWFFILASLPIAALWPLPITQEVTWEHVIKSLLFIPYYTPYSVPGEIPAPILLPAWTLGFEMLFYGIFALCLVFKPRGAMIAMLCYAILICVIGSQLIDPHSPAAVWFTSPQFFKFFAGCLVGYAFMRGVHFNIPVPVVIGLLTLIVLIQGLFHFFFSYAGASIPFCIGAGIISASFVACCVLTPFAGKKGPPRMTAIGEAVYSIYLCHFPILTMVVYMPGLYLDINPLIGIALMAIGMALSVWVGLLGRRYIEVPAARYLRSLRKKAE